MILPRFGLTVAALLGGLIEPATSYACGASACRLDQFLPRAGKVPANITAIGWEPGASEDVSAPPSLPRFTCTSADGGSREVRFEALPADRPDHLALSEPLVAGEHCTITSTVTDCAAEPDGASYLNGRAELDVVASSPLPETVGLIAITGAKLGRIDVAADASCSERIRACMVRASVVFSAAALPWKDALLFETIVDGERFSTWQDQSIPSELGGLYLGRDRDIVFAALGTIPENANGFQQLDTGEHTVSIEARLPGSDLTMATPPVSIGLDCGPGSDPALAMNVIEADSGGCWVASELGSSQRQGRPLSWSMLAIFGALLLAARRRVR